MHRFLVMLALTSILPAWAQTPQQGPDLNQINQLFFKQYDANGDGLVTGREFLMPSMAQFEFLDRNADGRVDMNEVSDFTRMMTEKAAAQAKQRQQSQHQSLPQQAPQHHPLASPGAYPPGASQ